MPSDRGAPLAGEPAASADGSAYLVDAVVSDEFPYVVKLRGSRGARYAEVSYNDDASVWVVTRFLAGGFLSGPLAEKELDGSWAERLDADLRSDFPVSDAPERASFVTLSEYPKPGIVEKFSTRQNGCLIALVFASAIWISLIWCARELVVQR